MANTIAFTGAFAQHLETFLSEKHTLGYDYREGERILHKLDEASKEFDCSNGLSRELVLAFTTMEPHWKRTTQEYRIATVNQFARYLIRHGIQAYLQEGISYTNNEEHFVPYIFSKKEIADIFEKLDTLKPHYNSSHHVMCPVLFRLLYTCGLRISEAAKLNICDVDFGTNTLRILDSKNHKDRTIPMSDVMSSYVAKYIEQERFIAKDSDPLFASPNGVRYNKGSAYQHFRGALWKCGISHGGRGRGPRLHDLRHTFAVHSLIQLESSGADMMVAIQLLSAYLGHNNISSTGKYLRLTAECYPNIRAMLEAQFGYLFPEEVQFHEAD